VVRHFHHRMTVRPNTPGQPEIVGLAPVARERRAVVTLRSEAAPDREGGRLPSGALAVLLTWDGAGQCRQARLGGASRQEADEAAFLADGWLELLDPDDRATATDAVRTVLAGKAGDEAREEPLRLRTGDRWAVLRVQAVGEAQGVTGASGVLVDATRSVGAAARTARLVEGFNRLRHPDEIVRAMLDEGVPLLGGTTGVVYVLSDEDELVVAGPSGVAEDVLHARFGRIARGSPLPAAEVMRTGRAVTIANPAERRRRYPQLDAPDAFYTAAFRVVPLRGAEGQPFGVLGIGFEDERQLRSSDPQLLQDVAAHCALALDRARLAVAAERDQQRLRFLDQLSGALSSTLRLDATLTELAGFAVPRIADWCAGCSTGSPVIPHKWGRWTRPSGRAARSSVGRKPGRRYGRCSPTVTAIVPSTTWASTRLRSSRCGPGAVCWVRSGSATVPGAPSTPTTSSSQSRWRRAPR
jgi:GAF domain